MVCKVRPGWAVLLMPSYVIPRGSLNPRRGHIRQVIEVEAVPLSKHYHKVENNIWYNQIILCGADQNRTDRRKLARIPRLPWYMLPQFRVGGVRIELTRVRVSDVWLNRLPTLQSLVHLESILMGISWFLSVPATTNHFSLLASRELNPILMIMSHVLLPLKLEAGMRSLGNLPS